MPPTPSLPVLLLSLFAILAAVSIARINFANLRLPARLFSSTQTPKRSSVPIPTMSSGQPTLAELEAFWAKAFDELPSTPEDIPAFFFGHGSPILAFPKEQSAQMGHFAAWGGSEGPTGKFLSVFGPMLLKKYKPKAILVFSAHWETPRERLVSDYPENPLLMDYYGFPPALYQLKFKSRGDHALAERIVDLYKKAGQRARLSPVTEARGEDGRGFSGPGLDHGVFVPFRIMFGEEYTDIPIVQVSIDASLDPEANWQVGRAVADLRKEGVLVLSGGLTAHNLGDRASFSPVTARQVHLEFDAAIHAAIQVEEAETRKQAMFGLTKLPSFRASQPREDHFVPLYVAAGAGEGGKVKTLNPAYGIPTFAFGL